MRELRERNNREERNEEVKRIEIENKSDQEM